MANNTAMDGFDPRTQIFSLVGPDGVTETPIAVTQVDVLLLVMTSTQVNYGSQIGATFIMLLVLLTMTPSGRFRRVPTLVNIAGLVFNLVRCVLLSLFFTSSWVEFYTLMTGDTDDVAQRDFNISVVATVFNIPVVILIEWALAVQAWSMIQLWAGVYKWGAVAISAGLVVATIGFKTGSVVVQSLGAVSDVDLISLLWVRMTDLVLSMASISWFCFLFVVRLVMHMWTHRTMLPSVQGLSAMEVLVMTNGILMLVPVIFAGLEFGSFTAFESGSLTYTSVVIVLPLGTLVAQRLANPAAFTTPTGSNHSHVASSRVPFLKCWQRTAGSPDGSCSAATSTAPHHGVTSHVVSNGCREKAGRRAAAYDEDLERGVRVDREIEHREERISGGT